MSTEPFALYPRSREWFDRAAAVIPGGIYGHTAPAATVPGRFPYFARDAQGCRYRDVDGREYIDFMCGYGPVVIGHADPEINEAVRAVTAGGDCLNHPTPLMVELAEEMVRRVDFADWAVFAKNGADVTGWAVQVARAATEKRKILKLTGGYHGTQPWCTPGHHGLLPEDRAHVVELRWNDASGLRRLAAEHEGDIAGLILTPFHHPVFADAEEPSPEFLATVHELRDRGEWLLIMDDIRGGFRLHTGGSHRVYGWNPDIACFCKALANGHPISAAVGRGALKPAASKVFLTGSYWNAPGPMAAALKCLEILDRDQVPVRLENAGLRLREGLVKLGARHGHEVIASGPPAVPTYRFAADPGFRRFQHFCALAAAEGVFFHPHHNWFLCAAHADADIDQALAAADRAFARMGD